MLGQAYGFPYRTSLPALCRLRLLAGLAAGLKPLAGVAANRGYPASQAHFRAASMWFLAKLGFYPIFCCTKNVAPAPTRALALLRVQCRVAALRLATRGVAPQQDFAAPLATARIWAATLVGSPHGLPPRPGALPPVRYSCGQLATLANVRPPPYGSPHPCRGRVGRIKSPSCLPIKNGINHLYNLYRLYCFPS